MSRHSSDIPRDHAGRPTRKHKMDVIKSHPGFLYVTCPTPNAEHFVFTGYDTTVKKIGLDAAYRYAKSEMSQ